MRRVLLGLVIVWLLGACGLERAGLQSDSSFLSDVGPVSEDASFRGPTNAGPFDAGIGVSPDDAASPRVGDGGRTIRIESDAGLGCERRRHWEADFDVDPTTLDVDGDDRSDWGMRHGDPFPAHELDGGVWRASGGDELDTRPLRDFTGETRVRVRMRSTSEGWPGAVFWINADQTDHDFAAIWLALERESDGSQTLRLRHKPGGEGRNLVTLRDLPSAFIDARLRIDPAADTVTVSVDGFSGTYTYGTQSPPTDDRFATLIAWGSTAEFDRIEIDACE